MNRLLILWLLLPIELFAQGEHLMSLPISKEILVKNKVSTINVYENVDSMMVQTNTYFINSEGKAYEHIYIDPANEGAGPFDIERLRWSKDTMGFVQITSGMYGEDGALINLIADYQYLYSSTGKLMKLIYHDFTDFHTIRMRQFDTLHPENNNNWEWRILNNDTLYSIHNFKDDMLAKHILKNKVQGKWVETEKSISTFSNGDLETYALYKNGKLVNEFDSTKDQLKRQQQDKEELENNNALPIPEPFIKTVYSDKMDLIFETNAKEKSAKFRLELHYENGISSDMNHYEVYDNTNNLLLIKSNPTGEYKTEFHYLFRK